MKKGIQNQYSFLVLIISGKKCTLYKHEDGVYNKITHGPGSVAEVINDAAEPVSNFSDPKARRQTTLIKFLRSIDQWLCKVNKYPRLPVFLLAPEKVAGHFKKITANKNDIAGHFHGNFDDLTIPQLRTIIEPFVDSLSFAENAVKADFDSVSKDELTKADYHQTSGE
jgi:hypothetical protein